MIKNKKNKGIYRKKVMKKKNKKVQKMKEKFKTYLIKIQRQIYKILQTQLQLMTKHHKKFLAKKLMKNNFNNLLDLF